MSKAAVNGAKSTTIRARILRLSIIGLVITCLIIVNVSCTMFYMLSVEQISEDMSEIGVAYAAYVNKAVDQLHSQIESVAKVDGITPYEAKDILTVKLAGYASGSEYTDYAVSGQNGKTTNDTDISDREYFKKAISGTTFVSSPVIRRTDNSIVYMVGAPLTNSSVGVLYGAVDSSYFGEILDHYSNTNGMKGYAFILDSEGTIVAHRNTEYLSELLNPITEAQVNSEFEGFADLAQDMIENDTGADKYILEDGIEYYVTYAPVGNVEGWKVAIAVPYAEITHDILWVSAIAYIVSVIVLIVSGLSAASISKKISDPIITVTERLNLLSNGDISTPVPSCDRGDETQELSDALVLTVSRLGSYVKDIDNVLSEVSKGNLNAKPGIDYVGDFKKIRSSLDEIMSSLRSTFKDVDKAATRVSMSAASVASGAEELSSNASTEAGTMEELASTVITINDKVKTNTASAKLAKDAAIGATRSCEDGKRSMAALLGAITEIKNTSQQISDIIDDIDDIAFQTNILALNAAVEAASAGAAGKGFAVVADEVRTLAGKSSDASKRTGELISASIRSVNTGTELAAEAERSLSDIVSKVNELEKLIAGIADAAAEQSEAISQIDAGVDAINNSIQSTSGAAEESAATAEKLSGEAQNLTARIKMFRF